MQKIANKNSKNPIKLNGCRREYSFFNECLKNEKMRLINKEKDL